MPDQPVMRERTREGDGRAGLGDFLHHQGVGRLCLFDGKPMGDQGLRRTVRSDTSLRKACMFRCSVQRHRERDNPTLLSYTGLDRGN